LNEGFLQKMGVRFLNNCIVRKTITYEDLHDDGFRGIFQRMTLGEADASGRRSPLPIEGAIETIDVDQVIVSVGVSPNPLIPSAFRGLEVTRRGTIVVNEATMRSTLPDVYAGGDIVRGGATVILAMGDGRKAASAMDAALSE
jgi:glutamate synthase (NADPH/NADH) small chain